MTRAAAMALALLSVASACGLGSGLDAGPAQTDAGGPTGTCYVDADGDGFGAASAEPATCAGGIGVAPQDGDCDDSRSDVNPEQRDFTTAADSNCDMTTEYMETTCVRFEHDRRCGAAGSAGWDVGDFPECGEEGAWCLRWDDFEGRCLMGERRTQLCL